MIFSSHPKICYFSYIYWDRNHPIICKFFDRYWDYITKDTLLLKILFFYRLFCYPVCLLSHPYSIIFLFIVTHSITYPYTVSSSILKPFSNGSDSPHTSSGSFLLGFSFKQSSVMNGNCSKKFKSFNLSS